LAKLGILADPLILPIFTIFQFFPFFWIFPIFQIFGILGIFSILVKTVIFGDLAKKVKNGDFWESEEMVKMTDLSK
jgi:hypothetical protein